MAIITVAREFGAGGKTLATRVAEKLDYSVIDEEIVEQVALEANVSPELLSMRLKKHARGIKGIMGAT